MKIEVDREERAGSGQCGLTVPEVLDQDPRRGGGGPRRRPAAVVTVRGG